MEKVERNICIFTAVALVSVLSTQLAFAHGDVTPQSIDTSTIPTLGQEWSETNPYRELDGDVRVEIERLGASAYNQNCARCHGLEGISGGIAPDLRMLAPDYDGDEWYVYRVQNGAVRNGAVYMPKMTEHLNQEALWAIRTWLESVAPDNG
ncbi:Cytochrome C550 (Soluble cytochrome C) [Grimontia indica]|uniref:Cytochrome C550 (Soluble cytochrome C) n=1 Tax=Grimontia indica TaxID=1056512 RepID=R1IV07_9GAMM|nr:MULTISPECIES: cytochrome c-550 PedF [Grimontia]EOD79145.1 Cytochrome C550 (Soluble cytochrome C) [Grimontia indica]